MRSCSAQQLLLVIVVIVRCLSASFSSLEQAIGVLIALVQARFSNNASTEGANCFTYCVIGEAKGLYINSSSTILPSISCFAAQIR